MSTPKHLRLANTPVQYRPCLPPTSVTEPEAPADSVRIVVLATDRPGLAWSKGYRTPPAGLSTAEAWRWAETLAAQELAKRRAGT
jgi:hypothetical protein